MTHFSLRPYVRSDATDIADVFAQSCRYAYASIFPPELLRRYTISQQIDRWTDHLANLTDDHQIIVAVSDESSAIIGFVEVGPSPDIESVGEINYLFVLPELTRNGVGAALLECAEKWFVTRGYHEEVLWVFCENHRALSFYRKTNWADETGTEQSEPSLVGLGFRIIECRLRKRLTER
jgi:ribosomal protein S18 acetylase RimI-like enzyme